MTQRRHFINPLLAAALLCTLAALAPWHPRPVQAQEDAKTPASKPKAAPLEHLLDEAYARTLEYLNVFKDLMVEERQFTELYDAGGMLVRKRLVVSDLVVYQSWLDNTMMVEYRNVREVDGVPVSNQQERALNLTERLVKVDSVSKELDRIDREASRYDLNYSVKGYTLNQGMALQREVRDAFEFKIAGRDKIEGHEVVVINYAQTAQHPKIQFKLSLPKVKSSAPLYRGCLWLDAQTAQLWREEREIIVRLPKFADYVPVIRFEFHYAPSKFKILVPQRITFTTLGSIRKVDGEAPILSPGGRVKFEYGKFETFDVSVKPGGLTPQRPR
jgi:hypothetical protein